MVAVLNGDLQLRVVSCRELVQDVVSRQKLSGQTAQTLGETITCTLMLGSSLKGEETLQVSLVGRRRREEEGGVGGLRSVVATVDSKLRTRGMVGDPTYSPVGARCSVLSLLGGGGEVQVLRTHPLWRQPQTGITLLRDGDVDLNLSLHLAESEQRRAILRCEVVVDAAGNCQHALGLMVEALPGCSEDLLEACIQNLQQVHRQGLRAKLDTVGGDADALDRLLDSCLLGEGGSVELGAGVGEYGARWRRRPSFHCPCSPERAHRALRLLGKAEIESMILAGQELELRCEFCAQEFKVHPNDLMTDPAVS